MKKHMMVKGTDVNLCAIPYFFINKRRHPKTNEMIIGVYGSTNVNFNQEDDINENYHNFKYAIMLKRFTNRKSADYWIETFIYEREFKPIGERS